VGVGTPDGFGVGRGEGRLEGAGVGTLDGFGVGRREGRSEGASVGTLDGIGVGGGDGDGIRQKVCSPFEKPLEHTTQDSDLPYDMVPAKHENVNKSRREHVDNV